MKTMQSRVVDAAAIAVLCALLALISASLNPSHAKPCGHGNIASYKACHK